MIIHLIFSKSGFQSCLDLIKGEDRVVFFYPEQDVEKCPCHYFFFKEYSDLNNLIVKDEVRTISWY